VPRNSSDNLSFYWSLRLALGKRLRRLLWKDGHGKIHMPVLGTIRLVLRPIVADDMNEIRIWFPHDPDGAQTLIDFCSREYRDRGIGPWGMQLRTTGKLLGHCGLPHINLPKRWGEVNYFVAPEARGQGLACEAATELFRFGFHDLRLARIQARCDPDNSSSERVMQKAKMTFEGLVDRRPPVKGASAKQKLYAILATDFRDNNC
jgi:[ribosomal protein S5]-alanine N-acetyltransferase